MRRIILAALLSSLSFTAAATPVTQLNDDASAPTSRPVSTGVTEARLIYTTHIGIPADQLPSAFGTLAKVVLKINLDETGTPTSIRVLQPITPDVDQRVVEAVRQFRWAPAVLNNQPVKTDLTLTVAVQR
ncbi:MAG TPA: TonB family protein [Terracidiphilus sp.]|jgi:TonB family protein